MVIIANKTGKVKDRGGNETEISFYKLIIDCISAPPEGGWTFDEMKNSLKIEGKTSSVSGDLRLEDSEFSVLKKCIERQKWVILSPFVVEFVEYITSLRES